MKTLHLLRHAKSSWADPDLADIDRPLNRRGLMSCQLMAHAMLAAGCDFSAVFCSPATRAQQTLATISEQLAECAINWHTCQQLYTFDWRDLWHWCQQLDDSLVQALVVGHNPAITEFCHWLSGSHGANLPTCGYVQLTINADTWHRLAAGSATLTTRLTPNMLI